MLYKILNIAIKNCAQAFNTNDVTPIKAAINVKISKLYKNIFEIIIVKNNIQKYHSIFNKFLNELLIFLFLYEIYFISYKNLKYVFFFHLL